MSYSSISAEQLDVLRQIPGKHSKVLLDEMIELFLASAPLLFKKILIAIEENNTESLASAAHGLKGSSSNFGAGRLVELLGKIESSAKAGTLPADETMTELQNEVQHVMNDLTKVQSD